jgi:hypothetical protein
VNRVYFFQDIEQVRYGFSGVEVIIHCQIAIITKLVDLLIRLLVRSSLPMIGVLQLLYSSQAVG